MSLDGLSLSILIQELHHQLIGGRIDKIFQPDKNTLLLWIRQPQETCKLFISVAAENPRIYMTKDVPDNPAVPPAFCMLLRKHLESGRIGQMTQQGLDRIIIIDIDVRAEQGTITTKQLIIELMGKHSNIIFVHNDIILDSIKRVNIYMSRQRQVLPGRPYLLPPGQERLNLFDISAGEVVSQLVTQHQNTVLTKALIYTVNGMGPVSAKEIVWRAGLPEKLLVNALDEADKQSLIQTIAEFTAVLKSAAAEPTVAISEQSELLAIAAFPLEHVKNAKQVPFSSMSSAVEYTEALKGPRKRPAKEALHKLLLAELSRLQRKKGLLEAELTEALQADSYRLFADTLMIYLHDIPNQATQVTLPDLFNDNNEKQILIPLDPLLSPLVNAQTYYTKYNKLQRRQQMTQQQLQQCMQELTYLESVLFTLEAADSPNDLEEIKQELVTSGYLQLKVKPRKQAAQPSFKPRQLVIDGITILIGRNNRQNDWVTFKQARPDDVWLHTKDIPGSHVIIRLSEPEIPEKVLHIAAQCAAWFSKARTSSSVPVDYTRRRNVKKPSGAQPGFVTYEHQRTLHITPDKSLFESLIETE
ncbi:NFACT RNA binding domain-containing protein [Anaerospora sp.]|uniref:Rqc2 family fibronectin-binding protein n=1 Tax=Anaerospora sp. TaxID=1960278 RepID=UPI0028999EEC|nr:NFACT RNA binding domain-containing protein [Anaerospora sp.]